MMSCRRAAELTSKELDTELRAGERVALGFHRLMCRACRRFQAQLAEIDRAVARTLAGPAGGPSVGLPEAARERIDAALETEMRRDGG